MRGLTTFFWFALAIPGMPFAFLLALFKKMGDGSGNESGISEFWYWSMALGVIGWVSIIIGIIWLYNYISVAIT